MGTGFTSAGFLGGVEGLGLAGVGVVLGGLLLLVFTLLFVGVLLPPLLRVVFALLSLIIIPSLKTNTFDTFVFATR